MKGFLKLNRTDELLFLLEKDPKAFLLMTLISVRARRFNSRFDNLKIGEAEIGDFKKAGLKTEGEYRKAKERLTKYGLCTFKSTNKGTVAKLVNTMVYDINEDSEVQANNEQENEKERAKYEPSTTNKKEKNIKEEKKEEINITDTSNSIIEYFHGTCTDLPKVQKLSDARKKIIKNRIKDFELDGIKKIIDLTAESDFLSGRSSKFKASFDWIFNSANALKIIEGNYKNRKDDTNKKNRPSFTAEQFAAGIEQQFEINKE